MNIARYFIVASVALVFCFALVANAGAAVTLDSTAPTLAWVDCWGGYYTENRPVIVVDDGGNVYVAGVTQSHDLTVVDGYDMTYHDVGENAAYGDDFVAKLTPDGQMAWSTFFGGSGREGRVQIAIDSGGNLLLAGTTTSADFPMLHASQSAIGGGQDIYIAEFTTGGALLRSTLLGGSGNDSPSCLAVDKSGAIFIAGYSSSSNFPGRSRTLSSAGGDDGLVAKLTSDGKLIWSALLGGSADEGISSLLVSPLGSVTVAGYAQSDDFHTVHGFQPTFGGGIFEGMGGGDSFVARLNPAGHVVWSSYYGGNGNDTIYDVRLDGSDNLYIAGESNSSDLPGVDPAKASYGGGVSWPEGGDGFVAKITKQGKLLWTTYLGGAYDDGIYSFGFLPSGDLFAAGYSYSQDWPSPGANAGGPGSSDIMAAEITPDGSPVWIKLIGGTGDDDALSVMVDDVGNVYVVGRAHKDGFPVFGAFPPTSGKFYAVALMRLTSSGDIVWSSLLGGLDQQPRALAFDGRGSLVVAGLTGSVDFPATNSWRTNPGYYSDVFIFKVDNSDSLPLSYGTTPASSANGAPTFTFKMQPGIVKPRIRFSTSPDFSGTGKIKSAPLKRTATSWKPSKGQWRVLQRFAGEGSLYWRIEGKSREGRTVYSETLSVTPAP